MIEQQTELTMEQVMPKLFPTLLNTDIRLNLAVYAGKYIIGSFHPSSGVNFAKFPVLFSTEEEARQECSDLAQEQPNYTFFYVKICGSERVTATYKQTSH